MTPIILGPLVKFLAVLEFKPTLGFAIGEAVLGSVILLLYKTRKSGPGANSYYCGIKLGLKDDELPRKESVNSIVASAFTTTTRSPLTTCRTACRSGGGCCWTR
jgi:hypothetical protein